MAKVTASVNVHKKDGVFAAFKKQIGGIRFYFGEAWGIDSNTKAAEKRAGDIAAAMEAAFDSISRQGLPWSKDIATAAVAPQFGYRPPVANASYAKFIAAPVRQTPQAPTSSTSRLMDDAGQLAATATNVPLASTLTMTADGLIIGTVADAIAAYKIDTKRRADERKIKQIQAESICERIDWATVSLPLSAPMTSIRRDELTAAVSHWLRRPVSAKTGERIGTKTVVARVGAIGQFFRWAYNANRWEGFRAWENTFGVDEQSLMTPSERKESKKPKPKFSVDELSILYSNATPRTRLYILLGLNCGMGQMEIATIRQWDLLLTDKPAKISRERYKTGVEGRWNLWAETVASLRQYVGGNDLEELNTAAADGTPFGQSLAAMIDTLPNVQKHRTPKYNRTALKGKTTTTDIEEPETLALLTEDGYPLVHGSSNAIMLAWQRLYANRNVADAVKDGKLRRLGFYTLRKTSAQWVRDLQGYETHKVYLAHSTLDASGRKSVSEKHYTSRSDVDYAKVADATAKVREILQPMFDTKATPRFKKPGPKPKPKAEAVAAA